MLYTETRSRTKQTDEAIAINRQLRLQNLSR
jgi:hypothetical protein